VLRPTKKVLVNKSVVVVVVVDIRNPVVLDGFLLEVLGWGWGRFRRGTGERREFGETWVGG